MAWLFGLVLKPFIGITILAVLYFGARWIAWLLWWVIPRGRVKDYLFRGWRGHARSTADLHKRVLHDPRLISRE